MSSYMHLGYVCPKCGEYSDQKGLEFRFDDGTGDVRGNIHTVLCKKCNHEYEFRYKMDTD